jgi:hypothetical protein
VATDRTSYAPGDPVIATTTVQNAGHRECRLAGSYDDAGCPDWILVHFAFDPSGDGNFSSTTWTFGPYPSCDSGDDVLPPGQSVKRTATFPFGGDQPGELPDGEWQVVVDWDAITVYGKHRPKTTFRCVPATCKPLDDYAPSSTTTTTS